MANEDDEIRRQQIIDLPSGGTATVPQGTLASRVQESLSRISPGQTALDDAALAATARYNVVNLATGRATNSGYRPPEQEQAAIAAFRGEPAPRLAASFAPTAPLQLPTSNDLIESAISGRRNLEARRDQLTHELGTLPLGRRGALTPRHRQIQAQLRGLMEDDRNLSQQESFGRQQLHSATQEAIRSHTEDMHTKTQNEVLGFYSDLGQLQTTPGTREHAQAVANVAAQYPLAAATAQVRQDLSKHSQIHDDAATRAAAIAQQFGGTVVPTTIGARGESYKFLPSASQQAVPATTQNRYAKLVASIASHQEQSNAERDKNIADKKPNTPYSRAPDLHADQAELAALEKRFPQLNPVAAPAADTPAPTPSAGRVRKYNPQTGTLE